MSTISELPGVLVSGSNSEETSRLYGALGLGIIWIAGLAMGYMEILDVQEMASSVAVTIFALMPLVLNLVLIGLGIALWYSEFEGVAILQIAAMVIVGITILGLGAIWTVVHQNIMGPPLEHAEFIVLDSMSLGAVIGFVLGYFQVTRRKHYRDLEQERAKLQFLNRILRHNILNSTQIILGNVDLLEDRLAESGSEHLQTIRSRCEEISRFIDSVRLLGVHSIDDGISLRPHDLSEVLADELEAAKQDFPHATFSASLENDLIVRVDDYAPELFSNLLYNAVQHNDTESPSVTISMEETASSVLIRVADDGPGIPDDQRDEVTEWNAKGKQSSGTGLGLAIVDRLVERYHGTLSIEDNDPRGTVVTVELPNASVAR
jgi:signal transduction histidine kinase